MPWRPVAGSIFGELVIDSDNRHTDSICLAIYDDTKAFGTSRFPRFCFTDLSNYCNSIPRFLISILFDPETPENPDKSIIVQDFT